MGLLSTNDSDSENDLATNFYFPTSKNALIVFARNPELGQCKTRLAKNIGNQAALDIYNHLLNHTANIASPVLADKYVFYSDHIPKEDMFNGNGFRKKLQFGHDLGARMENAFSELFQMGYEKIIIIGSDVLELNSNHIDHGFQALSTQDLVIGPATDGGYYLLGMKTLKTALFKNKTWGTSNVLKETLNDTQNDNVVLLEELNDIDTFEDIKPYQELEKFYKTHD